jgi:hypothetical protein
MKIQEKNYYLTPQEEALKDATKAWEKSLVTYLQNGYHLWSHVVTSFMVVWIAETKTKPPTVCNGQTKNGKNVPFVFLNANLFGSEQISMKSTILNCRQHVLSINQITFLHRKSL